MFACFMVLNYTLVNFLLVRTSRWRSFWSSFLYVYYCGLCLLAFCIVLALSRIHGLDHVEEYLLCLHRFLFLVPSLSPMIYFSEFF